MGVVDLMKSPGWGGGGPGGCGCWYGGWFGGGGRGWLGLEGGGCRWEGELAEVVAGGLGDCLCFS